MTHTARMICKRLLMISALGALLLAGCDKQGPVETEKPSHQYSPEMSYLKTAGFPIDLVRFENNCFVIDRCISVSAQDIRQRIAVGKVTQAGTNFIVSYNRVNQVNISIDPSVSQAGPDNWSSAIENAVGVWNGVGNCKLHLTYPGQVQDKKRPAIGPVATGVSQPDITIRADGGRLSDDVLGQADFPHVDGSSGSWIEINLDFDNNRVMSEGQKRHNMVHELGHALGLRHTNWQAGGEGTAVMLPRTPSTDAGSVMNGGTALNIFAGLTYSDGIAMSVLYPLGVVPPHFTWGEWVIAWPEFKWPIDNIYSREEVWYSFNGDPWSLVAEYNAGYGSGEFLHVGDVVFMQEGEHVSYMVRRYGERGEVPFTNGTTITFYWDGTVAY